MCINILCIKFVFYFYIYIYLLHLSFTFILYIHYTLTCTSILKLLLIDTIEENLIKKIDRKNCDEVLHLITVLY